MSQSTHRRSFLQSIAAIGLLNAFPGAKRANAQTIPGPGRELRVGGDRIADLVIAQTPFGFGGDSARATTINGTIPGPILRFREGEKVTLRVTNHLDEDTSIHWHGLLIPSDMDGVPGVSFPGIRPGETFTYHYEVRQNGTFWYHSHSSLQEQLGQYGPLILEPARPDPVRYDREHVVVLSDWTFRDPHRVLAVLKKESGFFNFQQRTLGDFFRDAKAHGFRNTLAERRMWAQMRMDPTDILDVTGSAAYTYLVNGLPPDRNWTGFFGPGERVRLRFINSAAGTNFNLRIPDLPMTVVAADGQNVQPVVTDEIQIAIAETYDVIVEPKAERAYTVFAEAVDRSGYGRGTLAPRAGMVAAVPTLRKRPLRNMVDMGMPMDSMNMGSAEMRTTGSGGMSGSGRNSPDTTMAEMNHGSMPMESTPNMKQGAPPNESMPGMNQGKKPMNSRPGPGMSGGEAGNSAMQGGMKSDSMSDMDAAMKVDPMQGMNSPINGRHGPDTHGPENQTVAMVERNRLGERGVGLENVNHRVLVYTDLKALEPSRDPRPPQREIEIHLTGNMEAFIWGMDGLKFSESGPPERLRVGERVRLTMVNDTMMEHPMHLHGVFMEVVNGVDIVHQPRKHTINVKPAERMSLDFTYDEPGNFAFHCHILYHMEMGMFRFLNVSGEPRRELT